jgi:N-acetylmuramoyl-L-alanine amidase
MHVARPLLRTIGLLLVVAGLSSTAALAATPGLRLSQDADGTRAELPLGDGHYTLLRLHAPERLAVDIERAPAAQLPASGAGVVREVRRGQPRAGVTRYVFDLSEPVEAIVQRVPDASGAWLLLRWPGDAAPPTAVAADATPRATARSTDRAEPVPSTNPDPLGGLIARLPDAAGAASAAAPATHGVAANTLPAGVSPAEPRTNDDAATRTTVASTPPAASEPSPAGPGVKTLDDVMRAARPRPLVIAIDPGHGGQDPGAIGPTGRREKDVTLAIGRELARQINATPGMQAYLTRDRDVFIPLPQRARLARAAHADMFVSIHADAAENRSARGSSVYVLSLKGASSQRARWLADKENASDMIGGVQLTRTDDTLASVLLDLTQSGHMKASEDIADDILGRLEAIGSAHRPHIERANFAVLRTSDMPAMLVETAYISNPVEERQLGDPAQQARVANAILDGIRHYFTRQPPPGTLFALRAARGDVTGSESDTAASAR